VRIPLFHLQRLQAQHAAETAAIFSDICASGVYLFGPNVNAFERSLAQFLGVPDASVVACHSGTDALVLAMLAAGVGPGDEVITAANGAIPTATAIVQVGARPVFCGVSPDSWLMDIPACSDLISPRTKSIIAVHLYGNIVDIEALRMMLREKGRSDIRIIEDVAQAFGGRQGALPVGSIGDFGAFSFYPTKNLGALGDAGAVVAKNSNDANALRALAFYGQENRNHASLFRGINSRLDEIQAAILNLRLKSIFENIQRRADLMDLYRTSLGGLPLRFSLAQESNSSAWHLAVIRANTESVRDKLRGFLIERGIQTLIHYPLALHLQHAFMETKPLDRSFGLEEAERIGSEILSIPFSHVHTASEIIEVAQAIRDFFVQSTAK
jgi:aminotransferase EvaB